jgi:hypothetical protein
MGWSFTLDEGRGGERAMAYASATGGYGAGGASVIHPNPADADSIVVPDAELLFRGDYKRAGPDLVITDPDGRHLIPGYFSSEKHPALVAPNGASLAPDVIDLLAGSPTPGQYAQAQPTTPPDSIGKIEKVIGNVTVIRNAVAVALHVGDAVYKGDVIQTAAGRRHRLHRFLHQRLQRQRQSPERHAGRRTDCHPSARGPSAHRALSQADRRPRRRGTRRLP